jgi:hypothetical protein
MREVTDSISTQLGERFGVPYRLRTNTEAAKKPLPYSLKQKEVWIDASELLQNRKRVRHAV